MSAAKHTPMTVEAGRALCKIASDACNVDFDDNWKVFGNLYLADAQVVLEAAAVPDLLELMRISIGNIRSLGPAGAFEGVQPYAPYREWLAQLEAAYAKATGGAA